MVDYLKEIDHGLIIEQPKIVLPWNLQKKEIFDIADNINVINNNYYVFKITLIGIPFINCAGLHFVKERLSKIELFHDKEDSNRSEIYDIFNKHQLVLENLFGEPNKNHLLKKVFLQVNIGDVEYKWKFRRITLMHKIWDRFGMEEVIAIFINR